MNPTDVIVIGAGPTGLMLAGELALAGVRCRILERRAEQPNITRAFAVHARTLEVLDARGVADDLLSRGVPVQQIAPAPGATLDLRELDTRYPMILIAPQSGTEHLLQARAQRRRMPDVSCDGGRLYELLRDGRFVLLEAPAAASGGGGRPAAGSPSLRQIGVRWSDRVRAVHCEPGDVSRLPAVTLVRPDGYVAWASDTASGDTVVAAVSAWCGPAAFAYESER